MALSLYRRGIAPHLLASIVVSAVLSACAAQKHPRTEPHDAAPSPEDSAPRPTMSTNVGHLSHTPLRRLSRVELADSVRALTGVDVSEQVAMIPADALTPFDGDADTQFASTALIEAARTVADVAATRMFLGDGQSSDLSVTVQAEEAQFVNADGSDAEVYVVRQDSAVLFLGAAGIRFTLDVEHPGIHELRAVLNGEAGGDQLPRVEVRVDGAAQLGFDVATTGFATYSGSLTLAAGPHTLDVVFVNDFWDPERGIDRNVAIDSVTILGPAPPGEGGPRLGCALTGPNDEGCLGDFIRRFGRLALRRPLAADEVEDYLQLAAVSAGDVDVMAGARLVVSAFLQDPEFLYRVETGSEGEEGVVKLDAFSVAARLAFLFWGRGPDDELLDQAASGELDDAPGRRAAALRLLDAPEARKRLARFHGMWLGVEDALTRVPEGLRPSLAREFDAMTERVVFDEDRSWLDLFTLEETFVDETLASHYGIALPGRSAAWTSLAGTGRAGVLGTGGYLAVGGKFTDTSPTQRGKAFRARLLCMPVRAPTPEDLMGAVVNVDQPPPGVGCKAERYRQHAQGACAGCHALMDPIGFGLEAFDGTGRPRAFEPGTEPVELCPIDGMGSLDGVNFRGPGELGRALVDNRWFPGCFARQLSRFMTGRQESVDDTASLDALAGRFASRNHRLRDLLLELVEDESFTHRRLPSGEGDAL
jgi:hypothetical protein